MLNERSSDTQRYLLWVSNYRKVQTKEAESTYSLNSQGSGYSGRGGHRAWEGTLENLSESGSFPCLELSVGLWVCSLCDNLLSLWSCWFSVWMYYFNNKVYFLKNGPTSKSMIEYQIDKQGFFINLPSLETKWVKLLERKFSWPRNLYWETLYLSE